MNKRHGLVNMVYNEKTEVQDSANYNLSKCPLHNANDALKNFNEFRILSSNKQKKLLHENNICFKRCTFSTRHAKDYYEVVSEKYSFQGGDTQQTLCRDVSCPEFSGKSCGEVVIVPVYFVELTLNC